MSAVTTQRMPDVATQLLSQHSTCLVSQHSTCLKQSLNGFQMVSKYLPFQKLSTGRAGGPADRSEGSMMMKDEMTQARARARARPIEISGM